jgi:type IV secretion system protein TrbB
MADRELLLSLAGPLLASYITAPDTIEVMCNDNGTCFLNRFGSGIVEVEHPGWRELDTFLCAVAHERDAEFSQRVAELSLALDDVGWRIEAGRPPVARALYMSLRRHPQQIFTLDDYERDGILTRQERTIIEEAVKTRQRMVVGGAVGSAKTSLLNACVHALRDTTYRLLVMEDDPELMCAVRNAVCRHVVAGQNSLRDLVRRSLRLAADVWVVGEVRGGEALDALKAGQTGHGLLMTVHVDDAWHLPRRLEQCISEVSVDPQRELIGEVLDLIVHMAKCAPRWRCTGMLAVEGYVNGAYKLTPLLGDKVV